MNFMPLTHPNPPSSHRGPQGAKTRAMRKFAQWSPLNQAIWLSQGRRHGIVEQGSAASPRSLLQSVALRRSR